MKFRLEADPDELREKADKLLKSLHNELIGTAPDVAEKLEKALPRKEPVLKYPVLRELQKKTAEEYERTLKRMNKEIGKVLDRGPIVKSLVWDEGVTQGGMPGLYEKYNWEDEDVGVEEEIRIRAGSSEAGEEFGKEAALDEGDSVLARGEDTPDPGILGGNRDSSGLGLARSSGAGGYWVDPTAWYELDELAGEALWGNLVKGGSRTHKYIRRVPYVNSKGKRAYRYYYRESSAARAAREGEQVRLGEKVVKVMKIHDNGDMILKEGENEPYLVSANAWAGTLAGWYGDKYYQHVEKRARQSISAVLKHVPSKLLADLRGDTDKARLADLKHRVPEVYNRLQASFQRAGVNAFQAKDILNSALRRKGWESDARALVVGAMLTPKGAKLAKRSNQIMDAAENLAGGAYVEAKHAVVAIKLVISNVVETAKRAERELGKLQKKIQEAVDRPGDLEAKAGVMAQAMASPAIQKFNEMLTAFPGLRDRVSKSVRDTMLEVPSVAPQPPQREGAEAAVYVAGEGGKPKALKARYMLKEASEVIPSHDPTSFKANAKYPEGVQERAYHRDKSEQMKVRRNAKSMFPALVVNTNPDAVNGPPLVTEDGIVLGGNSRIMSMQLAYSEENVSDSADKLKTYLSEHAHEVGLNPEDVAAMEAPILVRVVEVADKSTGNLQVLVRQMNESFTQAMDLRTMQVAQGRKLTNDAMELLAKNMEEGETLNKFLGTGRASGFINSLYKAGVIDDRNVNQYMRRGTKQLNADGKVLVARVLAGRVLDNADLLSETKHSLVESVAGAVPYMVQASGYGSGYDLTENIQTALDAYNRLQDQVDAGALKSLDAKVSDKEMRTILNNQFNDLFGDRHPVLDDPQAQALLELFIRRPGPRQMASVFKEYAKLAGANPEGQAQLIGDKLPPGQVFRLSVRAAIDKEAKEEAAKQSKKKGVGAGDLFGEKLAASMPDDSDIQKAGPFIGPRGGKWADAKHTVPWKEPKVKKEFIKQHKDIQVIQPVSVEPLHEVRDKTKLKKLTESMRETGWVGRPILVEKYGDGYKAWTGSHRVAAAQDADLEKIPVVVVDIEAVVESEGYKPSGPIAIMASDDEGKVDMLRRAGLKDAAKLMQQEVDEQELLEKAGPFIGPRGGKWKDAKHTIPWKAEKQKVRPPKKVMDPEDKPVKGVRKGDERFEEVSIEGYVVAGSPEAMEALGGDNFQSVRCTRCGAGIQHVFLTDRGPMGGDCLATVTGDPSTRVIARKINERVNSALVWAGEDKDKVTKITVEPGFGRDHLIVNIESIKEGAAFNEYTGEYETSKRPIMGIPANLSALGSSLVQQIAEGNELGFEYKSLSPEEIKQASKQTKARTEESKKRVEKRKAKIVREKTDELMRQVGVWHRVVSKELDVLDPLPSKQSIGNADSWVKEKVQNFLDQEHIPKKTDYSFKGKVGDITKEWDSPYDYLEASLSRELRMRLEAAWELEGGLFEGLFKGGAGKVGKAGLASGDEPLKNDFTEAIAEKDELAYNRVKVVLKRKGYKDSDFEEGGSFWGWSVNQLIDFVRNTE